MPSWALLTVAATKPHDSTESVERQPEAQELVYCTD